MVGCLEWAQSWSAVGPGGRLAMCVARMCLHLVGTVVYPGVECILERRRVERCEAEVEWKRHLRYAKAGAMAVMPEVGRSGLAHRSSSIGRR